jgi:hypothetical protein
MKRYMFVSIKPNGTQKKFQASASELDEVVHLNPKLKIQLADSGVEPSDYQNILHILKDHLKMNDQVADEDDKVFHAGVKMEPSMIDNVIQFPQSTSRYTQLITCARLNCTYNIKAHCKNDHALACSNRMVSDTQLTEPEADETPVCNEDNCKGKPGMHCGTCAIPGGCFK